MGQMRLAARSGPIDATVRVPGSKSVANRALVCALLADGTSTIEMIPDGDDVGAMVAALEATGRCELEQSRLRVSGGMAAGPVLASEVDCAIAGTTSRFLTAIAALSVDPVTLDGGQSLRSRPMGDLHRALEQLGVHIDAPNPGHLPVTVARGSMRGGRVTVRGDSSSQFLSALMMIGPVLPDGLVIVIEGELVSRPYVEMTASVMRSFGADVRLDGTKVVVAPRPYLPCSYVVEPDYSSAAFPLMAAVVAGGRVRIPGLAAAHLQGDERIVDLARRMGAVVASDREDIVLVADGAPSISPIEADMSDCSDLVPAVAVALGFAAGSSRLGGIGFIAAKESDRLADLSVEMTRAGIAVAYDTDGLSIAGRAVARTAVFQTHHDHRLAMALSLVSLAGVDVVIDSHEVVTKSWPGYFDAMSDILIFDERAK